MDPIAFEKRNHEYIQQMAADQELRNLTGAWFERASRYEYSYHFTWLGRPIIQFPQDILAMQEIIWRVQPDLIIETGIARGGSSIFYASMLELIGGEGRVVAIDIDIREHNRCEIEAHPLFKRITMIEGSSTDDKIVQQVYALAQNRERVLVALDSNHVHEHVLAELKLYSPLVTRGSYLVAFDTIIEHMPENFSSNRPWGKNNNPHTAVAEFLRGNDRFIVDHEIEQKLLITVAPGGYLKCIK
ncbi:MAG: cephalosporin hydroxylase family protein [candidate division KSB1 bacterium]|nr:cephalosporin hydroxylase family protein [candidate division KSB1 bacterium]